MIMCTTFLQIDILYPLASESLKWTECSNLPVDMYNAQAVWLKDKLYVGGGQTPKAFVPDDALCLYVYTPDKDTWNSLETPVSRFALTTYRAQLVIVGGVIYHNDGLGSLRIPTNKLWILNGQNQLDDTVIPPMMKERFHVSSVEYKERILVAGGYCWEIEVNNVEVYDGHQWVKVQCLPKACSKMKSAILNGFWYLMGGETQGKVVYYASLNALVGIGHSSGWKRLKDVPHEYSSPVVFRNRFMAIGGSIGTALLQSSIYSYSAYTQSWIYEGDIPTKLSCICTAILPVGKLTIIGGQRFGVPESHVYQAILNGKEHVILNIIAKILVSYTYSHSNVYLCFCIAVVFNPDSQFSMKVLSMLDKAHIIQLQEIETHVQQLQSIIKVKHIDANKGYNSLLNLWIKGHSSLHPTWRHLFWVLREIKLNHMADQIESYFQLLAIDHEHVNFGNESSERNNTEEGKQLILCPSHYCMWSFPKALSYTTMYFKIQGSLNTGAYERREACRFAALICSC